jgi:hypothetical protein
MTPTPLDLKFAPEARARILAFLSLITEYPPTLCLMKAVRPDDIDMSWTYGAYGPSNIEAVEPVLKEHGHRLLYSADGLIVAIPQPQFVPELSGKTLALGTDCLLVIDRDSDV